MNGDCGVFFDGDRQVGGCYGWVLDTKLGILPSDKWKNYKVLSRVIKTERWWLFEEVEKFRIDLYWIREDILIFANSAEVKRIVAPKGIELGAEQEQELIMRL